MLDAATAADGLDCVIVDLPRYDCVARAAALLRCDLLVVLVRSDVAGLVAAHGLVASLPEVPLGLVVRRGAVGGRRVATLVGAPVLGTLPALGRPLLDLDAEHLPRAGAKVAAGVLGGLRTREPVAAAR